MAALTQNTEFLSAFESVVVEQTKEFLFSVGKEFPDLNKIALNIIDIPSIKKNISLIVLITYTRIYNKRPQGLELSDKGKVDELANLKILIQSVAAGAAELGGQDNDLEISADAILTGASRAEAALHLHALVKVLDQLHRTYTRQHVDGTEADEDYEVEEGDGYGRGDYYIDNEDDDDGAEGAHAQDSQGAVGAALTVPSSRAARVAALGSAGRPPLDGGGSGPDTRAAAAAAGARRGGEEGDQDLEVVKIDRNPAEGGVGPGRARRDERGPGKEEREEEETAEGIAHGLGGKEGVGRAPRAGETADGLGELERGAAAFVEASRKQRAAKFRRQQAVHAKALDARERNLKRQQRAELAKKLRQQAELERVELSHQLRAEARHKRAVDDLMLKVLRELARDSAEDDAFNAQHLRALEQQRISMTASQASLFRDRVEMVNTKAAALEAQQRRMIKEQEKVAEAVMRDAACWQKEKVSARLHKLSVVEEAMALQATEAQRAIAELFNSSRLDFLAKHPDRTSLPGSGSQSVFERHLRRIDSASHGLRQQQQRKAKERRLHAAYGKAATTTTTAPASASSAPSLPSPRSRPHSAPTATSAARASQAATRRQKLRKAHGSPLRGAAAAGC